MKKRVTAPKSEIVSGPEVDSGVRGLTPIFIDECTEFGEVEWAKLLADADECGKLFTRLTQRCQKIESGYVVPVKIAGIRERK